MEYRVRVCPECGERVPAGIVRHRSCYLKAADRVSMSTEMAWRKRFWGEPPEPDGGGDPGESDST